MIFALNNDGRINTFYIIKFYFFYKILTIFIIMNIKINKFLISFKMLYNIGNSTMFTNCLDI